MELSCGARCLGAWTAVLLRRVIAVAAIVAGLFAPLVALAYVPPPLRGHVNDHAGKLAPADVSAIEAKLSGVRKQSGHEIVVLLLPTLGGETIEDVAHGAFNTWKIGQKGADDGVLLVIAPAERKVRIETGKGVGGALTDLEANDVIRTKIAPSLKQERFREAIERGTDAIAAALAKGAAPRTGPPAKTTGDQVEEVVGAVLVLLIAGFFLLALIGAIRDALSGKRSRSSGGSTWSSSSDSSWSSSSGPSSSSGGSSYSGGGGESGGGGSSDSY